ncbi:MAG: acyl-CoA dehydrogenase family protein [Planctomycetes bacterium]|nr:acyl-CoA dehydrogenase family protein [Planctomycetota bacterium]MCB9905765.1 acyl-CoA dehydrogenase family protein [Planctomycetota bacterium]
MDFTFSEEHQMLRQAVRDFTDGAVRPLSAQIEREHHVPRELLDQLAELGLYGVAIPEEYGGAGMGETGLCIAMEEITRGDFSVAVTYGAHASIGAMSVLVGGTEEQKRKWLPSYATGEVKGAYALSEADAGSDPAAMSTTAVKDGGDWIINGEKIWITAGNLADLVTVYAITDKTKGASGGVTAFLVPAESKGYSVGKAEEKMGQRGSSTVTLAFDDVRISDEYRLGEVGAGFKNAMATLDRGRLALGANCLGCAKEALSLATNYANERVAFGKPISRHQAIQWMLADSATEIYAMESLVYRTAWMCDEHVPFTRESAMTKLFASEALDRIVDRAVQIYGGMGYSAEYPIEKLYRDARVTRIYEGTNEIQRMVIARDVIARGI